jgi:hypothetical protein
MTWLLSYIGSTWALILAVVIAVVALGAIAWFSRNWKVAVAAVVILGAGLAYQQIDKNAYERRVSEEAAAQVKALQARVALLDMINRSYAEQAAKDADDLSHLREQAGNTPANGGPCLDEGAADRIGRTR